MSTRASFAVGEVYHLYNRGTEKRKIFLAKNDYERFTSLLYFSNGTRPVRIDNMRQQGLTLLEAMENTGRGDPLVGIAAYCLMPNHFHLLVRETKEGGISRFMQKLTTAYTMYFNTRHERTGALFGGTFKSRHADEDRYLKYLLSYIHLNPIKLLEPDWKETGIADKKKAESFLDAYDYSSYQDYTGIERPHLRIIDASALPEYFEMPKDFKSNVSEWFDFASKV